MNIAASVDYEATWQTKHIIYSSRFKLQTFYWSSFNDAESLCKIIGGHLTSIHSLNENAFVADLAKTGLNWSDKNHLTWIGLRRADYLNGFDWFWTDGTPVDFQAWAPNEPDNSYGKERCVQVTLFNSYIKRSNDTSSTFFVFTLPLYLVAQIHLYNLPI
ncbi:unnamed protein product [Cylicostephanus goldi]|uniref:C-type lectin domain-containing protein n=1 Tax=Cylicostephanus goldi TaxID=71465 RepID=A0A3P6S557_CYLGO|nr:unnamed protein product [Cylicostephanus goldi]